MVETDIKFLSKSNTSQFYLRCLSRLIIADKVHYVSLNIKNTCVRRGSPYKYVLWNSAQYRKQKILFSHSFWLKHSWSEILGKNHHSLKLFKLVFLVLCLCFGRSGPECDSTVCSAFSFVYCAILSASHFFPLYLLVKTGTKLSQRSLKRKGCN